MATLDDFFAKKDRKKAKGKKFTTTDEIAKKLEETGKKIEKTKKDKATLPSQTPGQGEEEQGNQVQVCIMYFSRAYDTCLRWRPYCTQYWGTLAANILYTNSTYNTRCIITYLQHVYMVYMVMDR